MPPVTIKLDSTKLDMRNGSSTGSPVSGWMVESIVFLACHSSGVMSRTLPVLYAVTSCLACSRPAADVRSVLRRAPSACIVVLSSVFPFFSLPPPPPSKLNKQSGRTPFVHSPPRTRTHTHPPCNNLTSDRKYSQSAARDPSMSRGHTATRAARGCRGATTSWRVSSRTWKKS